MKTRLIVLIMLLMSLAAFPQRRTQDDNQNNGERRQQNASPAGRRENAPANNPQNRDQSVSPEKKSAPANNPGYRNSPSQQNPGNQGDFQNRGQNRGQYNKEQRYRDNVPVNPGHQGQNRTMPAQSYQSRGQRYQQSPQHYNPQQPYYGRTNRTSVIVNNYPRHQEVIHRYVGSPLSIEVRRNRYPYRAPVRLDIVWDIHMFNNFRIWYPDFNRWHYDYGYHIPSISAYEAADYDGEVVRVYGRVFEAYYSDSDNLLFLYFGGFYPYQDFAIVIPGDEAFRYDRDPVSFFEHQHVAATGLITFYNNKPEMWLKQRQQIEIY
jgi:hypothetical protein